MAFYGDAGEAATLAGVTSVASIIQDQINAQIDAGIYPDGFGSTNEVTEYYDVDKINQESIVLGKTPVVSVATLVDDAQADSPTTIDSDSYAVDTDTGVIHLHNRNDANLPTTEIVQYFFRGKQSVKVTYTYGYADVPNIIKQLATLMAARWARFEGEANFTEGERPLKRLEMADFSETYDASLLSARNIFDGQINRLWKQAEGLYKPMVLF